MEFLNRIQVIWNNNATVHDKRNPMKAGRKTQIPITIAIIKQFFLNVPPEQWDNKNRNSSSRRQDKHIGKQGIKCQLSSCDFQLSPPMSHPGLYHPPNYTAHIPTILCHFLLSSSLTPLLLPKSLPHQSILHPASTLWIPIPSGLSFIYPSLNFAVHYILFPEK